MRTIRLTGYHGDVFVNPLSIGMVYDNPEQDLSSGDWSERWHGATLVTLSGATVDVRERAEYVISECNRNEPLFVGADFALQQVQAEKQ